MTLSSIAKKLGSKGGKARAKSLGSQTRRQIASLGGRARAKSLQAKRRILENFRYLEAMRDLSPGPKVARTKNPKISLPGLFGSKSS